jgi:hypothetical protein
MLDYLISNFEWARAGNLILNDIGYIKSAIEPTELSSVLTEIVNTLLKSFDDEASLCAAFDLILLSIRYKIRLTVLNCEVSESSTTRMSPKMMKKLENIMYAVERGGDIEEYFHFIQFLVRFSSLKREYIFIEKVAKTMLESRGPNRIEQRFEGWEGLFSFRIAHYYLAHHGPITFKPFQVHPMDGESEMRVQYLSLRNIL